MVASIWKMQRHSKEIDQAVTRPPRDGVHPEEDWVVGSYGATHVPKSNSLMFPFTAVMCWVTLTLSTVPEPCATTCNLPVKLDWKVPCSAFSVPPNHSALRML